MRLADVVGHEGALERLQRAAAAERLASVYLLTGPPGIGKRLVADAFAACILCDAPVAGDACRVCAQCTCVAAGTHPDLRTVERDEERRDIRIEQVRELARWLALQPLMAQRKV
ncbi:MAG: DNA polymerase III subunit delta', partial [Deltaproteobacteria bacterium]